MTDIVKRLREAYLSTGANYVQEAADEIERLREDNETLNEIIAIHGNEINIHGNEINRLRAALERAHDVWETEAVDMQDEIERLRAEREQAWNAALESAIDACIAVHSTTATTRAANSVRNCVDAIRALKDVK